MNNLQKCIFKIFCEVDRICNKYSINYSIIGGSMIGAVRHQGFIPWDDDMDIAMLRSDYDKFLSICAKELDSSLFYVQTTDKEINYAFSYAKILLKGTSCHETFAENANITRGIWLDIFPLDNLPNNWLQKKTMNLINYILKSMIWVKCGYGESFHKRQIKYHIVKILSSIFDIDQLKQRRNKLLRKYNNKKTSLVFISDFPHILFKRIWFDSYRDYLFEGKLVKGIESYNEYLTFQYGDYMKLPPVEQQKGHNLLEIDYGPYGNGNIG